MPSNADYVQISQHAEEEEEEEDDEEEDDVGESPSALHLRASSSTRRFAGSGRTRQPGKIDLRSLDNAFKRWTTEITQKVKRKKKTLASEAKKEIVFSVFQRVAPKDPFAPKPPVKTLDDGPPKTDAAFDEMANSIKVAILDGVQPKMITKGSSGSYFARRKLDGRTQVVGVFKPKDEEPYGHLNPKTTKWIHRNFFWWVGFGRACLIPNLSYISEAAASLLDDRLDLQIVPQTKLVSLSSPAFSYGWMDRANWKKGKPLPDKVGSLQTFMHGYQDATQFLRDHPWPGRAISDTYDDKSHRAGSAAVKRCSATLGVMCGRIGEVEDDDFDDMYDRQEEYPPEGSFSWTPALQEDFREELEKLIILDYLMRNTDRGLDNFMIKYCEGRRDTVVNKAPLASPMPYLPTNAQPTPTADPSPLFSAALSVPSMTPGRVPSPRPATETEGSSIQRPHIHLAAIDNSLSFPHQHPKGWREFTYGWLFLPVSLIGRPFSKATRDHFLPLLSDPEWWSETTFQLRKLHKIDDGFNERMFQRQMAVMKGQGWNIVQSLNHLDEGPLELTRRTKVMVWDEEIEVPVDATPEEIIDIVSAAQTKPGAIPGDIVAQPTLPRTPISTSSSTPGVTSVPSSPPHRPPHSPPSKVGFTKRSRSYSIGSRIAGLGKPTPKSEFPPFPFPGRSHTRRPSVADPNMRPVPLSTKNLGDGAMLGGATGVSVLEHLEKLDVVESGLNKAIGDGMSPNGDSTTLFEAEEDDVGESGAPGPSQSRPQNDPADHTDGDVVTTSSSSSPPPKSSKPTMALALDLGSPPRRINTRKSSALSAIVPNASGPSLEQLLGSDDLESGLQGRTTRPKGGHLRWGTSVDVRPPPVRTPNGTVGFDFSRDPLRKMRIVVAERLETVDATPFFSGW